MRKTEGTQERGARVLRWVRWNLAVFWRGQAEAYKHALELVVGALPDVDKRNLHSLWAVRAAVRWVSFEPLLAPWKGDLRGIQWVVIGGLSGHHAKCPEVEWVGAIMEEAGRRGIPIWMKRNLSPCWPAEDLIQELPGEKGARPGP